MEDVKFTLEGVVVPIREANIVYDLMSYYCVIEMVSEKNIPLTSEIICEGKNSMNLIVIGTAFSGGFYQITLVTKNQWEVLNITTEPVEGEYSLEDLLKKLGVGYYLEEDTESVYWSLPELNYTSLLRKLNKYCPGVAPRFYLDLAGTVRMVDLGSESNSDKIIAVGGAVKSDVVSLDWITEIPQSVVFYSSSVDGYYKEEVSHTQTQTKAKIFVNDTTGHLLKMVKRAYENDYNYRKYTSRKIIIESVTTEVVGLGCKVSVGGDHNGIVSMVKWPMFTTTNYCITVQVVCPV